MNIKKTLKHSPSTALSNTSRAWLKIVYIGFALCLVSVIFHIWLFFSAGKIVPSSSTFSVPVETIDRAQLTAVLSNYTSRQSQKISQTRIDAATIDPSK